MQMHSIDDTHFERIAASVHDEQKNTVYMQEQQIDILQKASRELLGLQCQLTSVVRAPE